MDSISGFVDSQIDGETFLVHVTAAAKDNRYEYDEREWVRLAEWQRESIRCSVALRGVDDFVSRIAGKFVLLTVHGRHPSGDLICEIAV